MIDTWMVLLFPYLDFIPFAIPRYLLFKDRLRIPFRYVMLLLTASATLNSFCFYLINTGGDDMAMQWTTIMRYGFMLINLILSFSLIKESFSKLMFTYLLIFAWSFFVFGNANYIESRFFWDFSDQHPYLIYNISRILIYLITCPFMFRFFKHTIKHAMKIQEESMWKHLWKIPLFSSLFGMLYCFNDDIYAYATWQFLVSRYLMMFGACYVSYVALKVLEISRHRTQLEEALNYADKSILAQKKQFDSLAHNLEQIKKNKDDFQQHLTLVQSYIEQKDNAGLSTYIDACQNKLSFDLNELYSHNDIVNAIVCYYAAIAKNDQISFHACIDYPKKCSISDTDITVLLGNILENAIEACQRQLKGNRFIRLNIQCHGDGMLHIVTDNTCDVVEDFQNGIPLSSKRKGMGIGASSIKDITERYHGSVRFEYKEHLFFTTILMQYQ